MARRFGVEMEFSSSLSCETILEKLNTKGLPILNRGHYAHSSGTQWDLKTDSSACHNGLRGYEVASRILEGDNGLKELEWFASAMTNLAREGHWSVNKACGVHVHFDLSDYDRKDLQNLIQLVIYFEPVIFGVNPPSRSNNNYCRPIARNSAFQMLASGTLSPEQWSTALATAAGNRYHGMNLSAYITRKTVEFRYGGASLNPKKILAWVSVLAGLVEKAKESRNIRLNPADTTKTLEERKEEMRKTMAVLRKKGLTYKITTAHKTFNARFETFTNQARAQAIPALA